MSSNSPMEMKIQGGGLGWREGEGNGGGGERDVDGQR